MNRFFSTNRVIDLIFFSTEDVIDRVRDLQRGQPIKDAVEGWCPVAGCEQVPIQLITRKLVENEKSFSKLKT